MQDCSISSFLALQILQSCTKLLPFFTSKDIHVYILFWWIYWSIIELELRNQPLLTMVELFSIFKKKFHSIIMSYLLETHFVYFVSQTMGNRKCQKKIIANFFLLFPVATLFILFFIVIIIHIYSNYIFGVSSVWGFICFSIAFSWQK